MTRAKTGTSDGQSVMQRLYGVPVEGVRCSSRLRSRLMTWAWRLRGRCMGAPAFGRWWFAPEGSRANARARRLCASCPVRQLCLASALLHGEEFGIWGGLGPRERLPLARRLRDGARLDDLLEDWSAGAA